MTQKINPDPVDETNPLIHDDVSSPVQLQNRGGPKSDTLDDPKITEIGATLPQAQSVQPKSPQAASPQAVSARLLWKGVKDLVIKNVGMIWLAMIAFGITVGVAMIFLYLSMVVISSLRQYRYAVYFFRTISAAGVFLLVGAIMHAVDLYNTIQTTDEKSKIHAAKIRKGFGDLAKHYLDLFRYMILAFLIVCAIMNRYTSFMRRRTKQFLLELGCSLIFGTLWGIFIFFMRKSYTSFSDLDWKGLAISIFIVNTVSIVVAICFELAGFNSMRENPISIGRDPLTECLLRVESEGASEQYTMTRHLQIQIILFLMYLFILGFAFVLYLFLVSSFINVQLDALRESYSNNIFARMIAAWKARTTSDASTASTASTMSTTAVVGILLIEAVVFGLLNQIQSMKVMLVSVICCMPVHLLFQNLNVYGWVNEKKTSANETDKTWAKYFNANYVIGSMLKFGSTKKTDK